MGVALANHPAAGAVQMLQASEGLRAEMLLAADRTLFASLLSVLSAQFGGDPYLAMTGGTDRVSAQLRDRALYLSNTGFGRTHEQLSALTGLARSSVTRACQRVEDSREDASLNWKLERVEQLLGIGEG